MVTAKELAARLDGAEYGLWGREDDFALAKQSGLVIVYGMSDDLMEFEGAIDDEADVFNGCTVYLTKEGLMHYLMRYPDCDPEWHNCPYYMRERQNAKKIKARWCAVEDKPWTYETDIPHETFRVYEDGELFCEGIVFSVEDL